jgi:L-aminopeptidase/D-esterase-like protein
MALLKKPRMGFSAPATLLPACRHVVTRTKVGWYPERRVSGAANMDRRSFGQTVLLGGAAYLVTPRAQSDTPEGTITDVPGVRVGHFTSPRRPTGCTVILTEAGATGAVDVRGSAPGTRETDLLNPVNTVQNVHAVVLSGGSAFGLDAASGVVRYLRERGVGFPTRAAPVPIVPAAILYDLGLGDPGIWPDAAAGYAAAEAATDGPVAQGNVGAGAGATVGKTMGMERAMKGGLGSTSLTMDDGIAVGAIVAVNCVGNVIDPLTGQIVAGARNADNTGFVETRRMLQNLPNRAIPVAENTTIAVVATNAVFSKAELTKVAQMAQDGLARTIYPAHTPNDGDTVFAVATGTQAGGANAGAVGALAAEVLAAAILQAVREAESLPGLPAWRDYPGNG